MVDSGVLQGHGSSCHQPEAMIATMRISAMGSALRLVAARILEMRRRVVMFHSSDIFLCRDGIEQERILLPCITHVRTAMDE